MEIANETTRKKIVGRVKRILLQPRAEWDAIAAEPTTPKTLYLNYIVILAAIGPIASIIGMSLVGISIPFLGHYRVPLGSSIGHAIVGYVLTLIGTYVLALIINGLAPSFGGAKNQTQALKVAAYSQTPGWVIAVVMLYPPLGILRILGLYGLFLLFLGLPPLMKAPRERALGYAVVTIIAAIVIYVIIGWLAGMLISYPTYPAINP